MRELALNILDITENSVKAGASLVVIEVKVDGGMLKISVEDDGCGMSEEFLKRVTDPYTTTRTTRKVGMGIPLLKMEAEMAGGEFSIRSEQGKGTRTEATFQVGHIDRPPLGDLGESMMTLLSDDTGTEFVLRADFGCGQYEFDTRELKAALDGVPVNEPEILLFVRDMIKDNIKQIGGERL